MRATSTHPCNRTQAVTAVAIRTIPNSRPVSRPVRSRLPPLPPRKPTPSTASVMAMIVPMVETRSAQPRSAADSIEMRVSPLAMCASSWPATASSWSRSRSPRIPLVNTIVPWCGPRPMAKALAASSSITSTWGIAIPIRTANAPTSGTSRRASSGRGARAPVERRSVDS
jgi:hypothetical protein